MRTEILAKLTELSAKENINSFASDVRELKKDYKDILSNEKVNEKPIDEELTEEELLVMKNNKVLDDEINGLLNQFNEAFKAERKKKEEERKKNLVAKQKIIEDFKALVADEENIGIAFNKRKEIQERWKEVGSVPQDNFEEIQTEYSRLNDDFSYNINLYKAIKDHDLKKNYSLKNQIIFELEELKKETSVKKVQDTLNVLRLKWDEVGPTFKEEWEALKDNYWTKIDETRTRINDFYKAQRDKLADNLLKKKELIEKAKELTSQKFDSTKIWKTSTEKVIELQNQWKKIGPVAKEKNKEIWDEFRGFFDEYFTKKKAYFSEIKEEVNASAKLKKELLAKANELKFSDLWSETSRDLVGLQKKWKQIGHAGKLEQKLWTDFRTACNEFFDKKNDYLANKDDIEAKNLSLKEELIATIKNFDPQKEVDKAREKLKDFSKQFIDLGNVPFSEKNKIYSAFKAILDEKYKALKIDKKERESIFFKSKLEGFLGNKNAGKLISEEKDKLARHLTKLTSEIQQYENNIGFFGISSGKNPMLEGIKKKIEQAKEEIDTVKEKIKAIRSSEK
jgi:hypothetical protein